MECLQACLFAAFPKMVISVEVPPRTEEEDRRGKIAAMRVFVWNGAF
jgi:hypothetical protein